MTSACPKCGFAYAWDGTVCGHCQSPSYFLSLVDLKEMVVQSKMDDDDSVIEAYRRFFPSCSALWSAGYRLGAAGFICHRHPHLAARVLPLNVEMVWYLGFRQAIDLVGWAVPQLQTRLENHLAVQFEGSEPSLAEIIVANIVEAAEMHGVRWLIDNLPRHVDVIQSELDRVRERKGDIQVCF